jgi:hypothetical protein
MGVETGWSRVTGISKTSTLSVTNRINWWSLQDNRQASTFHQLVSFNHTVALEISSDCFAEICSSLRIEAQIAVWKRGGIYV